MIRHYVTAFLVAELGGEPTAGTDFKPGRQDVPDVGYRATGYRNRLRFRAERAPQSPMAR